jgi:hypothetical protein
MALHYWILNHFSPKYDNRLDARAAWLEKPIPVALEEMRSDEHFRKQDKQMNV